jgi:hypothetical protein
VAAAEAVRDPLGAALYCCYRFATKLGGRWLVPNADQTEYWQIKPSTWRT